jgi:hypothetical protein
MKTITLLTRLAVVSTAAFALALVANLPVAGLFALAGTALAALLVVHDYSKPARRWHPALKAVPARTNPARFRLAA